MCLCSEEFNDRILRPDLSDAEMQRLHEEVQKIYETYCLEESIDKISFDPFIIEEIHNSQSHLIHLSYIVEHQSVMFLTCDDDCV